MVVKAVSPVECLRSTKSKATFYIDVVILVGLQEPICCKICCKDLPLCNISEEVLLGLPAKEQARIQARRALLSNDQSSGRFPITKVRFERFDNAEELAERQ